jgi:hypothetical protein
MVAHDSKHTCDVSNSLDPNLEDDNVPDTAPIDRTITPVNDEEEVCSVFDTWDVPNDFYEEFPDLLSDLDPDGNGFLAIDISILAADRANPPKWRLAFLAAFAAKAPSIHVDGVNQF